MPGLPSLSESEWMIMTRLWERFPLTAVEIVETELDGKTLPDATVRTLLRRLVAKKAVGFTVDENKANLYRYFPLICEQDCIRKENQHFLDLYYRGNASKMFAALVNDAVMSDEEIERFRVLLESKKEDNHYKG
jgi:BlaI family penicillinase repressor